MSNWPTKKLGEICDFQFGFSFKTSDFNSEGKGLPVIRIGDLEKQTPEVFYEKNYDSQYLVKPGDILVGLSGTIITKIWNGPKGLLNQRVVKLKNFRDANKKFVFYALIEPLKRLSEELFRSAVKNVLKHHLYNLEIPLPPLPIQQKIVSILDTIQSAIEVQEKIMEKAKELKKSMMAELFKYGAPSFRKGRKLKKTEIGEIPENWDVVRLGEVVEKIQYGISKKGQREGEYPILRMNNLMEGQINTQDLQFVDLTKDEFDKFKLIKGDIIFNRTNSIELVGKTALFDLERDFVFASYLLRIRVNILKLLPQFLNWYFNWGKSQERLKKLASRGASQVNISATRLRTFQIPLPPLPEQREIAEILQTIDQKIEIEKKKKELYEELFKTMLNKIMNQEINVEKIKI